MVSSEVQRTRVLIQAKYECFSKLSFDETQRGMCILCSNNRGCPLVRDKIIQITVSFLCFVDWLRTVSSKLCVFNKKHKKRTVIDNYCNISCLYNDDQGSWFCSCLDFFCISVIRATLNCTCASEKKVLCVLWGRVWMMGIICLTGIILYSSGRLLGSN